MGGELEEVDFSVIWPNGQDLNRYWQRWAFEG